MLPSKVGPGLLDSAERACREPSAVRCFYEEGKIKDFYHLIMIVSPRFLTTLTLLSMADIANLVSAVTVVGGFPT
jgi:hypothetical protein